MNGKKLLFGIIVISIIIILNVPLLSIAEEIRTHTYPIEWDDYAVSTFIVKKGWTLSVSYTSDCEHASSEECEGNEYPTIKILGPDDSIVWEQTNTSESEFILLSESGGALALLKVRKEPPISSILSPRSIFVSLGAPR